MRVAKVSTLTISHFVPVRSAKGANYSVVSISADNVRIPELHIVGTTLPNSGTDVIVAYRGASQTSVVGWLDPVTLNPVVAIPNVIAFYPIVVLVLFPLFVVLFFAFPSKNMYWFGLVVGLLIVLHLIPAVGWPGVARRLKKYRQQSACGYH